MLTLSQSTAKVKTGQLWGKSKEDLTKQLEELQTELGQLRVQKIAGGAASKLTRMYVAWEIEICWMAEIFWFCITTWTDNLFLSRRL